MSVQNWFDDMGVELDLRAHIPDLETIEHLWNKLGRGLQARSQHLRSASNLLKILEEETNSIPVAT